MIARGRRLKISDRKRSAGKNRCRAAADFVGPERPSPDICPQYLAVTPGIAQRHPAGKFVLIMDFHAENKTLKIAGYISTGMRQRL